jgi:hypothetical protein
MLLQIHVVSGHIINELDDAHSGRKIWSVRHSQLTPHLCMSASEDRTAKLWSGRTMDDCAATIAPPCGSTVCCADFSSSSEHLVALACSSHKVYCYDLRYRARPLAVLDGHRRATSYVRFFGADRLITSSIDGSLACWDLGLQQQQVMTGPVQQPLVQQQQQGLSGDALQEEVARLSVELQRFGRQEQQQHRRSSYEQGRWGAGCGTSRKQLSSGWAGYRRRGTGQSEYDLWRQQQVEEEEKGNGVGEEAAAAAAGQLETGSGKVQQRSFSLTATAGNGGAAMPLWSQQQQVQQVQPWKRFQGHLNVKNFVGLSVRPEDGLLACGSETDQVFTYHTSWSQPLATFSMAGGGSVATSGASGRSDATAFGAHAAPLTRSGGLGVFGVGSGSVGSGGSSGAGSRPEEFVSAVAWQPWHAAQALGLPKLLAAATSMGGIRLLSLVEP